ncbi:MAG: hypothetical protein WCE73_11335 [Candidatus Angelobacter sp.]
MNEKVLSRSKYEVICEFTAFRLQSEEGFEQESRRVQQGVVIWADPAYWKNKPWEGIDAVQFDWNQGQFYVDPQTFLVSTRKASAEEKKA